MSAWKQVGLSVLLAVLCSAATAIATTYWVQQHLAAHISLPRQQVAASLAPGVEVHADLTGKVEVNLDTSVATEVPLDQHFQIPLDQTITAIATIDHSVPVKGDFHVKQSFPVDTTVFVDTVV